MTREKANKYLSNSREDLKFWQEYYVDACRSKKPMMDTKMRLYDYMTPREHMKKEAIENMNEIKERIARFERIAR